jgi:asparagine synthase (glutamine-hydrolysing)
MCGIAGLLKFKHRLAEEPVIRRMTDAIAHRGPDSDGFYTEGALAFGHRRLSIIDLSTAANQPFRDRSGRYVMVYNGEMYNYQEVRQMLPDYPFVTSGDTEVLLAAYLRWGADCLQYFRGMYAFAIWDRQEQELFLARDKMGVKPLYYYRDENQFVFASEIRAILVAEGVKKKLNPAALTEYFSTQSIGGAHSVIEGIRQLEAGYFMKIGEQLQEKHCYWDITTAVPSIDVPDPGKIKSHIRRLLLQSVSRRLVSDVPVGAFLSGGIDSSAVVGLMAEASPARPNTFTVSFEEKEYDESSYAELIAKKFNTVHTRMLLKPTVFLDELENAVGAMDTPSGDGVNTYVVSKAIRQNGMTVALSGVGGDELFAGYPFFRQFLQLQNNKWLWSLPQAARRTTSRLLSQMGKGGRIGQILRLPSPAIANVYPIFRQMLSSREIQRLTSLPVFPGATTELAGKNGSLSALPLLSQVSVAEYLGYTRDTLLKDTDQMSMASGLEVREPFFDQDLIEYVLAVPDSIKTPTYPKSLLVESLKPMLPDEIVHRRKQGFLFPWELWMRKELKSFADAHIRNMCQRDFVNGAALMDYWSRFLAGDKHSRWSELWLFIVLDHWLEANGVAE